MPDLMPPPAIPQMAMATPWALKRLLVVEDERIVAKDLTRVLEGLGYSVVGSASTGDQAIEMAHRLKPDLILMDVCLQGDIDGIQAAHAIKARQSVAIVYLTAFSDSSTLQRAAASLPGGYVVKPFRQVELQCAVEVAFSRHRMEAALQEREELFRSLSLTDELTGLFNRRGFLTLAAQQVRGAQREKQPQALLFADLDGLKGVNDRLGHATGDEALMSAAAVLKKTFRKADVVARIGGDEFVVLVNADALGAQRAVTRLRELLDQANRNGAAGVQLHMSVGVALRGPQSDEDLESLIERADAAMYTDKRACDPAGHSPA